MRDSDTISRVGGDEFNILLADITHIEGIATICRKIMDSFRHRTPSPNMTCT